MHIYLNPAKESVIAILVSEDHSSITRLDIGSGATISLTYNGLDRYVPHVLRKVDLLGREIHINQVPVVAKAEPVEVKEPEVAVIDEVKESVKATVVEDITNASVEVTEVKVVEPVITEEIKEPEVKEKAPVKERTSKFGRKS